MKVEKDIFYVISEDTINGTMYWKTKDDGAVITCWGDALSADRFGSYGEAMSYATATLSEYGRLSDDVSVKRVTVTVKVDGSKPVKAMARTRNAECALPEERG